MWSNSGWLSVDSGWYRNATSSLDPATTAWVNAVISAGGTVSGGRQTVVDTFIKALKSASLFAKMDRYWLFASENTQQATIDLISLSTFTNHGMTFSANNGFTADGATTYGDTGYDASTATHYAASSAAYGLYCTNNRTTSVTNPVGLGCVGASDAAYIQPNGSGSCSAFINTPYTGILNDAAATTTQGSWIVSRTSSIRYDMYLAGTSVTFNTTTSSNAPVGNWFVGAGNNSGNGTPSFFSPDSYGSCFMGGAFSSGDATAFEAAQSTLMTSIRGSYP